MAHGAQMVDIISPVRRLFAKRWRRLHAEEWLKDSELRYPGVYLLAFTEKNLEGKAVRVDDGYYVGMSNAAGGVRARLRQFKSALERGYGHSAGNRCYQGYKGRAFSKLRRKEKFYFAALCMPCSSLKSGAQPNDFRVMGRLIERRIRHADPGKAHQRRRSEPSKGLRNALRSADLNLSLAYFATSAARDRHAKATCISLKKPAPRMIPRPDKLRVICTVISLVRSRVGLARIHITNQWGQRLMRPFLAHFVWPLLRLPPALAAPGYRAGRATYPSAFRCA